MLCPSCFAHSLIYFRKTQDAKPEVVPTLPNTYPRALLALTLTFTASTANREASLSACERDGRRVREKMEALGQSGI